jgi:hypothetical protein
MTTTDPPGTLAYVWSLSAATLYQGNCNRNHKLWNIGSAERYILHMQVLLEYFYIYIYIIYINEKFTMGKLISSLLP